MITYDSSNWLTLFKIKGSVFPKAARIALFSAAIACVLKYVEQQEGGFSVTEYKLITQSTGFSYFTSSVAFVLIFRTNQCYSRFWHCARSVSTMRALMVEAASSLVAFSIMSKKSEDEVQVFRHTMVRLFSMLHAMCLSTFCDREAGFALIDVEVFDQKELHIRLHSADHRERVDVVYMWINALIIRSLDNGLLNVPPPILSRVLQEMEKAMVEFHQIMQVMEIPFPFPYAQMAIVLLFLMSVGTPVAMCYWTDHVVSCGVLTFMSVLCLASLEFIADELDNPFGMDENDLPCEHFQEQMNASLILLLTPGFGTVPLLTEEALQNLDGCLKRMETIEDLETMIGADSTDAEPGLQAEEVAPKDEQAAPTDEGQKDLNIVSIYDVVVA